MKTAWGRLYEVEDPLAFSDSLLKKLTSTLATGNLKSYGDSCLLGSGPAFSMLYQDHFLAWNPNTGRLKIQSGVLLDHILQTCVPQGWFLPVTPGTKYVTVGGCIANDIHGKNHHLVGNFGHHVLAFELLRSNGERLICSPDQNSDMFKATVGGLGLTGIITWAEIQLIHITSSQIDVECIQFKGIASFLEINQDSHAYLYTVAWLDCLSQSNGKAVARGIYMRGTHAQTGGLSIHQPAKLKIPLDFPSWTLNSLTVNGFNTLYYHKQLTTFKKFSQHYDGFFYPLDKVLDWNRIYGKPGFYQYQCVVPLAFAKTTFQTMLDVIAQSGQGSFLSVLKTFGSIPSLGLLSFPEEGLTLCLDFANKGKKTLDLMKKLDELLDQTGGKRYPAKDATMTSDQFKRFYPNWQDFLTYKDPLFTSDFWQRVLPQS